MSVPARFVKRVAGNLKTFQDIIRQQKARDVSEDDTVTIVKDVLCEIFGYDKYLEVTSRHAIRKTFCDLAIEIDQKLALLIEVKAIGLDLNEKHLKQAIDYAANKGCEWVALTNSIEWRLYYVLFKKPIDKKEVIRFNLLDVSAKNETDIETIYLLTRASFASKSELVLRRDLKDATSRFGLAAIILNSEPVRTAIRRELRRLTGMLVDSDTIDRILREEVIKRETIEGEESIRAARQVMRSAEKSIVNHTEKDDNDVLSVAQPSEH